jgi:hypothetical protein
MDVSEHNVRDSRRWAWRIIGALMAAVVVFVGYSVVVSKKLDEKAVTSGSSSVGPANTPQDLPNPSGQRSAPSQQ